MIIDLGPSSPIPFESSWMLMLKACAFNLVVPGTLFEVLASDASSKVCPGRHWVGDWIDLSQLSRATQLPTWVLRRSFIDQIGTVSQVGDHHIRHCKECISHGYHSILFQFQILTHCPWHGCQLLICKTCTRAVEPGGLAITALKILSREGCMYKITLCCGHFNFLSGGSLLLQNINGLPVSSIVAKSINIIVWLRKAYLFGAPGVVINSLVFSSDSLAEKEKLFDACLNYMELLIGCCPWRLKSIGSMLKLRRIAFKLNSEQSEGGDNFDYVTLFKSIRRYLFERYVKKQHKRCWNELSHLDPLKLHALDVTNACSVSSAFLAWQMALQWDEKTGFSQYERINFVHFQLNRCPVNSATVGFLWLLHFFAIWAGIERECVKCHSYQDRFSVEICSCAPPLTLGEDCVLCYGEQMAISGLCISPDELERRCSIRCLSRLNEAALVNQQATWNIYYWAYDRKLHVLLRFWRGTHSKRGGQSSVVVAG
ncbi:hypothetical protein K2E96_18870 [Pseudomonas sp. ERGC3:05]|nr:hypothetical protein [Pseudomonas sp. ERGC3:01]QZC93079.1 hypothetical protein K2E96_18870 [Pseudomonas sp. ERGC3:05]